VARGGSNTFPVGADLCPQPPPRAQQFCNMIDCPVEWKTGEWSQVLCVSLDKKKKQLTIADLSLLLLLLFLLIIGRIVVGRTAKLIL
jgi:hypothetical protein